MNEAFAMNETLAMDKTFVQKIIATASFFINWSAMNKTFQRSSKTTRNSRRAWNTKNSLFGLPFSKEMAIRTEILAEFT